MNVKKTIVVLVLASFGWALCGATIAIGKSITTMGNTLIIHAILAPVFFSIISIIYFKKLNYTTPLQTAFIFFSFVLLMDLFLVAPVFEKSYEMFINILGTWIPFVLIFISTYFTGLFITKRHNQSKESSKNN